ncbi:MAG TPA: hypothetical protein VFP70_08080 [Burkholderiales bacterium]|nr:hypothetical protein [Burkholderiales bacterium]
MDSTYDGIFVARGAPEDIRALKHDAALAAELEPEAGKEAVIGDHLVLVFRRRYWGRPALEALARQVAGAHRRIEIAVALWQPNGMGVGVGFRRGVEWHRLDSGNPGAGLPLRKRALSGLRKSALARLAARRAQWFVSLLSLGKLAWVMAPA